MSFLIGGLFALNVVAGFFNYAGAQEALPDLTFNSAAFNPDGTVTYIFRNAGTARIENVNFGFASYWLRRDGSEISSDGFFGNYALSSGITLTRSLSSSFITNPPADAVRLCLRIDHSNTMTEVDETNNEIVITIITSETSGESLATDDDAVIIHEIEEELITDTSPPPPSATQTLASEPSPLPSSIPESTPSEPTSTRMPSPSPTPIYQCNNGIDDDRDAFIDLKDPGCTDNQDNDETNIISSPSPSPPSLTPISTVVKPTISSFAANPTVIAKGQSSTLSWTTGDVANIVLSPTKETLSATGKKVVTPALTTTYNITAINSAGSVSASATVTVK